MMLFEPQKNENPNDPYMLTPKGLRVRVKEERVRELLAKGFTIVDPNWKSSDGSIATTLETKEDVVEEPKIPFQDRLEVIEI